MNTVKCERFRVVQTFAGSPEFLEQGTTVAADLYRDRLRGSCTHDCGRLLLWEKDWVYDLGYTLPQREFFGTGAAYLKWLATLPADVRGSSLQASRYGGLAHRGVSGILQALFVDCEHTSTRRRSVCFDIPSQVRPAHRGVEWRDSVPMVGGAAPFPFPRSTRLVPVALVPGNRVEVGRETDGRVEPAVRNVVRMPHLAYAPGQRKPRKRRGTCGKAALS